MEIRFREFNPFNCWIWLRFSNPPGQGERGYIDTTFESWFFLGKLGGFNAENLQVHEQGADVNWMAYDGEGAERAQRRPGGAPDPCDDGEQGGDDQEAIEQEGEGRCVLQALFAGDEAC